MKPRAVTAVADDARKLGLALVIASMIGGLLQGAVDEYVAIGGSVLGIIIWSVGIWLTNTEEAI